MATASRERCAALLVPRQPFNCFADYKLLDIRLGCVTLEAPQHCFVKFRRRRSCDARKNPIKHSAQGGEVLSCTILTCAPNDAMGELHDRMPVILAEGDWPKWLGKEPGAEAELWALLQPCPDDALKIWPVGKAVGNVKNKGPQLAAAI